jgi:hypothetical protein
VLRSHQQLAAKGGFAGTPAERFFRADTRDIGIVVIFRKVRQHQIARPRVESLGIGEKRADHFIRKMSRAAHDALLHMPGIRTNLEHLQIVIRFEHDSIAIAQMLLHQFGHVTEIGHERELHAGGAKREAERVDSIVGNTERSDFDIADAKSMAGLNELDALEAPRMVFGKKTQGLGMGFRIEIDGRAPGAQQGRETADVIGMFVRDDDAVEAIEGMGQSSQAPQGFALSQAGIHQQARPGSLEQSAIARTARRENAHAKADGSPPIPPLTGRKRKKAAAGIMAKARGARQCDSKEFVKKTSAGQQIARQAEALERADDRGGNFSRLEKFHGRLLDVLGGDGLD